MGWADNEVEKLKDRIKELEEELKHERELTVLYADDRNDHQAREAELEATITEALGDLSLVIYSDPDDLLYDVRKGLKAALKGEQV